MLQGQQIINYENTEMTIKSNIKSRPEEDTI